MDDVKAEAEANPQKTDKPFLSRGRKLRLKLLSGISPLVPVQGLAFQSDRIDVWLDKLLSLEALEFLDPLEKMASKPGREFE